MMGADAVIPLFENDDNSNDHHCYYHDTEALKDILDFTGGLGANVIIVATSNPSAIDVAQKIASRNSKINLFAGTAKGVSVSLDPNWLHYNQITITGSFSSTPDMLQQAANVASTGDINLSSLISHRYSLANIKGALLATEKYYGLRVVINDF